MLTKTTEKDGAGTHEIGAASTRGTQTLRLLFVDDYADFLSMVQIVFRDADCVLKTETQSVRALEIAAEFKPHIVVSDIGMPVLDGYELVKKLRGIDGLTPFKAIALSGYDNSEHRNKALLCGFDACLIKPVDFEQLREIIDELFGELIIETMPEQRLELRPGTRALSNFSDD